MKLSTDLSNSDSRIDTLPGLFIDMPDYSPPTAYIILFSCKLRPLNRQTLGRNILLIVVFFPELTEQLRIKQ